jgi:hypothetical protein
MPDSDFERQQKTAATRDFRLQIGRDPDTVRWQEALEMMLIRESEHLVPGRLSSYDDLEGDEAKVLKALAKVIIVPDDTCVIYIPPSIMAAMMADGRLQAPEMSAEGLKAFGEDVGILIGARCGDFNVILYVQFGLPPAKPGAEVYQDGEIVAVYQYPSIQQCISELNGLIETFLVAKEGA